MGICRRGEFISFPEISIPILASEEFSPPSLLISCIRNGLVQSIPELCEQIGSEARGMHQTLPERGEFHSCLSHRGCSRAAHSRNLSLQLRHLKTTIFLSGGTFHWSLHELCPHPLLLLPLMSQWLQEKLSTFPGTFPDGLKPHLCPQPAFPSAGLNTSSSKPALGAPSGRAQGDNHPPGANSAPNSLILFC